MSEQKDEDQDLVSVSLDDLRKSAHRRQKRQERAREKIRKQILEQDLRYGRVK